MTQTRYTAQFIETEFKRTAISRISQKKAGKSEYTNDAGYWDGGRCNWGAAHNLKEDCETLAEFFAGITELRNARKELIRFNNQDEFERNKQALLGTKHSQTVIAQFSSLATTRNAGNLWASAARTH